MNTKEIIYHGTDKVLGTTHLILQSLTDLTAQAEVAIVKRTGIWKDGKEYHLPPKADYLKMRTEETKEGQERLLKRVEAVKQWKFGYNLKPKTV